MFTVFKLKPKKVIHVEFSMTTHETQVILFEYVLVEGLIGTLNFGLLSIAITCLPMSFKCLF